MVTARFFSFTDWKAGLGALHIKEKVVAWTNFEGTNFEAVALNANLGLVAHLYIYDAGGNAKPSTFDTEFPDAVFANQISIY